MHMKSLTFVLVPRISPQKMSSIKVWLDFSGDFPVEKCNDLLGERMNDLLSSVNAAVAADSDVSPNFKKVLW